MRGRGPRPSVSGDHPQDAAMVTVTPGMETRTAEVTGTGVWRRRGTRASWLWGTCHVPTPGTRGRVIRCGDYTNFLSS